MQSQFYLGIVEDRLNDPLKLGRVRVRVFGVHSELLSDVPTSSLPWAIPLMPATSASLSGIGSAPTQYLEGSLVFVFFQDGDAKQQPIIIGSAHGIPLAYDPYDSSGTTNENFDDLTGRTDSTTPTVPDTTTTPETPEPAASTIAPANICCTKVDTTRLLAKYSKVAANVTLVGKTLCDYGIKNPYAIIAILSNIAKECKFVPKEEDLNYRTRAALEKSWPARFKPMTDAEVKVYFNNPQKLANFVYSNRNGNGVAETNDGYKYRGYGFIQLTGRANFKKISKQIGVDIEAKPELASTPAIAAKVVAQFFVNAYGGANRVAFTSLDEALVSITRTTNSGGFKNDYPIVVAESKLCSIIGEVTADTNPNPNDPVNDVNPNLTTEEINSGKSILNQNSTATGFRDMSGRYPLKTRFKEPDTHRLSRRTTIDTLIDVKNKNRRKGIRSIGSEFSEPAPAYNAKYPFNHVHATESGHVLEFDDTAGAERISLFHTSGTYSEVDKYGNKINKIIGDSFTIIERNGYVYVDGTVRLTVNSDVKIVVAGNLDIEVDGNVTYDVGGDVIWKVGGNLKHGIGGNSSTQADGNVLVDAAKVYFNSGMSEYVGSSARSGATNDYDKREPENYTGETTIILDDVHQTEPDSVDTATEDMVSNGTATQKEIDAGTSAKPSEVDTKITKNNLTPLPQSCLIFNGDFSDNIQISRKYTLAMLTTKAYFSHAIVAQHGLSKSQIACNLKGVAENCLDKIKEQYPKMFITSGFRPGSSSSQHELGQAIDMQFDVPNNQYFEIAKWIRDNVVFDKLLLEYKTTGTGKAWIHIAYRESPRKEVYTYMNDKKHSNGLANLG